MKIGRSPSDGRAIFTTMVVVRWGVVHARKPTIIRCLLLKSCLGERSCVALGRLLVQNRLGYHVDVYSLNGSLILSSKFNILDDRVLSRADREEMLSRAYVRAVAGYAGYALSKWDLDRDGVDLTVHAKGEMSSQVALQLKATVNLGVVGADGCYRYDLEMKDYVRLIMPSQVPRYLVVLALPRDEAEWLEVSVDQLVLRRSAYFVSLVGLPERENTSTVRVRIPGRNLFDVGNLRVLLEESRKLSRPLLDGEV